MYTHTHIYINTYIYIIYYVYIYMYVDMHGIYASAGVSCQGSQVAHHCLWGIMTPVCGTRAPDRHRVETIERTPTYRS